MPHFLHCPHVEGEPSASELLGQADVKKVDALIGATCFDRRPTSHMWRR